MFVALSLRDQRTISLFDNTISVDCRYSGFLNSSLEIERNNMKVRLAFFTSALLLGSAAHAEPAGLLTAGSVSAGFGDRDCKNNVGINCGDHFAYDLGGRVSVPFGTSFSIQADADYEDYSGPDDEDNQVTSASVFGLHASYRDPDKFLLGAFGSYSAVEVGSSDTASGFLYGAEGQYYFDRVTLYAQIGKADISNDANGSFDGSFWGVALRYFWKDDIMFEGTWTQGGPGDTREWSVQGKMRLLKQQPLYGFFNYVKADYFSEPNPTAAGRDHTVSLGLTWEFDAFSLYANDRRGATLTSPMLPGLSASWTEVLD